MGAEQGSPMQDALILSKPFHFVQHRDMLQSCLSSAEWLSCLDVQSLQGKPRQ